MTEPIKTSFGQQTCVGPGNLVVDGSSVPPHKIGVFHGDIFQSILEHGDYAVRMVTWTFTKLLLPLVFQFCYNTAAAIVI